MLVDPPDETGDEVLRFVSERRKVTLKGRSFREFAQRVIPLLDGKHSMEQIAASAADVIDPADLGTSLAFLAAQGLVRDAADTVLSPTEAALLEPQLNFFHEIAGDAEGVQRKLAAATFSVVGLAGAGSAAAAALAAAGVGEVRCIDAGSVSAADPYLSPLYDAREPGEGRASALTRRLERPDGTTRLRAVDEPLGDDAAVERAVDGSAFVVCALDAGQSALAHRLNRVCLRTATPWITGTTAGYEITVGPAFEPGRTACYMCYTMRGVAASETPEDEFAFKKFLNRRQRDDSAQREGLVVSGGIVGNLLALEALKAVGGFAPLATRGRVRVTNLITLAVQEHVVLRKPGCPACYPDQPAPS